jgi:hypothetical protein
MRGIGNMQEAMAVQIEQIGRGLDVLTELRSHLALPKFQGEDNDWIATSDLQAWIQRIQDALTADTDVIRLGSKVVSFDSERRYSGVRGEVIGYKQHEGCLRYKIAVQSRFVGGAELAPREEEALIPQIVIPPVNGVERLFGGRCNGVELAG